jgi:hypothetical protein
MTTLDVVEIDAASNRGVDDARDLRERAMYAPSDPGRSKVYIIDEAHMPRLFYHVVSASTFVASGRWTSSNA